MLENDLKDCMDLARCSGILELGLRLVDIL